MFALRACLLTLTLKLRISRDTFRMRAAIWIIGLVALGTSLDSSLYGGVYTRAVVSMFYEMALGMHLIG